MPTVMITGANRGIGLEFVRQYAAGGWKVLATCRNPIGLGDLARVEGDIEIHGLDVTDPYSITRLAKDLEGVAIDILLNSAGILALRAILLMMLIIRNGWKFLKQTYFRPLKSAQLFYQTY